MDPPPNESPSRPLPRVTVILPTYNRARFLPESVGSVLRQTFSDLELIIVDDGSTDATGALVRGINDDRVRYFVRPHRGLCASLNFGMGQARGEYVARLDSDDALVPDALSILVAALDANPAVGGVWAKARVMSPDGHDLPRARGGPERFPGDVLRSLVYDHCMCCSAMLVRRGCFQRVGLYDEALTYSEDWDMALRLAQHVRLQFVDRFVARVREHADSMSGLHSPQRSAFLATRTAPLDKLFRDPQVPAAVAAMRSTAYANVHIFRGRMWMATRNVRAAVREFVRAMRVSGRPMTTAIDIMWRAAAVQALERSAPGRRALAAVEEIGRRRRAHAAVAPGVRGDAALRT